MSNEKDLKSNSAKPDLKVDNFRWDLSCFYSGITDPQIDKDVDTLIEMYKKFHDNYKGQLDKKLGASILDYSEIIALSNKVEVYVYLQQSLDQGNAQVKAKEAEIDQKTTKACADYLEFFSLEIIALEQELLDHLYQEDEIVKRFRPMIEHTRLYKDHVFTEEIEAALSKRSSAGPGAWSSFFSEIETDLRFQFKGEEKRLTELLDTMNFSLNAEERAEAMYVVNEGFKGYFAKYSAQTLYMTTSSRAIETEERKYSNPMSMRNKANSIPDEVVDALHKAVTEVAAPLAQKYYRLKAKLSGQEKLAWSDRNALLPFSNDKIIPFDEALEIVLEAYQSFSPTLATIVQDLIDKKRIDAPSTAGKASGAFNYSISLPNNQTESFTFLNYLGSADNVMTLAHELGHGVHGILAGQAQGPLMSRAPITYCETASIFGEMITFNSLKEKIIAGGDNKQLLCLLFDKVGDIINTVVRQIGFSNFEKRLHGMDMTYEAWQKPKKLSVEEINAIWLATLQEFYGPDGDIFTYENTEYLWTYISHFHRPFYVYGYAFGELLTHSLYAQKDKLGEKFEPLYLDLLRAGSTKDVVELLKPFGLDPTSKTFWAEGIEVALANPIREIEIYQNLI